MKVTQNMWDYVSKYDPRFYSEIQKGIEYQQPLTEITSHNYSHLLPKDCYDCIDGTIVVLYLFTIHAI